MGEARRRRRRQREVVEADPWCIYCGEPATTVDHMPPSAMFGVFRPSGMEFPCCDGCNQGTKRADQVASFLSTVTIGDKDEAHQAQSTRLARGVRNNIPGFFEEVRYHRGAEKLALSRAGLPAGVRLWKADGPIVTRHMQTFAAKLGFAVHYEQSGHRVGPRGGVRARWLTNKNLIESDLLEQVGAMWGPETLRQGQAHVADRFTYRWLNSERLTGVVGLFGQRSAHHVEVTFAVLALASDDPEGLEGVGAPDDLVARPGDFKRY
jgi:hypothetical protein